MLYLDRVAAELEAKRESFLRQEDTFGADLARYRAALRGLWQRYPTAALLRAALEDHQGAVGALPLAGYDAWTAHLGAIPPLVPFGRSFAHHEAARAWAEEAIAGVTTVAVDGSQILPWREASVPVALIQAGIFVNPHTASGHYEKDIAVEVLAPDDLLPLDNEDEEGVSAEALVNLRRFELEARTLANWMRAHPQRGQDAWGRASGMPLQVAILDGSLIVSFALKMHPHLRFLYVQAATDLLAASEASGVPLAAYIDTSRARDLISLLRAVTPDLPPARRLTDAVLWEADLAWGDAAVPWLSARGDVLADYGARRNTIAFTYLRAAADRPPARIELPGWVTEHEALLARVLDVLRAELIVGNGYPYAIETADALAVIAIDERERFYQLFQQFAQRGGLRFTISRKAISKSRRR